MRPVTIFNFYLSGLGSALSPAELRAAEAAERRREEELEQERRDLEIARRLQVLSPSYLLEIQ